MKRTLKIFGMLLMSIVLMTSCGKDDNEELQLPLPVNKIPASYKFWYNGKKWIENDNGIGHITEAINDINSGIGVLSDLTLNAKESIEINNIQLLDVGTTMSITGKKSSTEGVEFVIGFLKAKKAYEIKSGTITRDSENKISFTSTTVEISEKDGKTVVEEAEIKGYIISDVIKELGKKD